jgi:transposase
MTGPIPCPKCGTPRSIRKNGHYGGKQRYKPYCIKCENRRLRIPKRRWNANNKEKRRAQKEVEKAIRRGTMIAQPCARCGSVKHVHAHHEDYASPLDVMWLCSYHHFQRHEEIKKAADSLATTGG